MRDKGGFLGNFVLKKSHLKALEYRKFSNTVNVIGNMQCTLQSVNSCVSIIEKLQNIGDFFCFVPSIKDSGRLEKNVRKLEYMSEVFDTPTTKY